MKMRDKINVYSMFFFVWDISPSLLNVVIRMDSSFPVGIEFHKTDYILKRPQNPQFDAEYR